jgi:hypothetical protein
VAAFAGFIASSFLEKCLEANIYALKAISGKRADGYVKIHSMLTRFLSLFTQL